MDKVSRTDFLARVVLDTFPKGLGESGCLLLFTILHCYQFELAGPFISDSPKLGTGSVFPAETQRECGSVCAELWSEPDSPQSHYMYWYRLWNEWGSYSRFDKLTPEERARMRQMIAALESHPFVARLIPEDFDPAAEPT